MSPPLPVNPSTLWRKIEESYNAAQASSPNELRASYYDDAYKVTGSGYNDEDAITNDARRMKIRWGMSKKEREVVDLGRDEEEGGGSDKRNRVDDDRDAVIGSSNYTSGGMQRSNGVKKAKSKHKGKGKNVDMP
ncbi:Ribonuclease 3, partial [Bienertia sinuspersici]